MNWSLLLENYTRVDMLIQAGGLMLLCMLIFLETGSLMGVFLPGGDYMLFTAGLLAGSPVLPVPWGVLWVLLLCVATAGDVLAYWKGRYWGPRLFRRPQSRLFKPAHLDHTRALWHRYGIGLFFLGRFLPIVRTLLPRLLGAIGLDLRRFFWYDLLSGLVWIGILTGLGHWMGRMWPQVFDYLHYILLAVVILASIPVVRFWKNNPPSNSAA